MNITKIKNSHPEVFKDRFILVAIILSVWAFIKLLENLLPDRVLEFLPGPLPLALLFVIVAMMVTYSIASYLAQKWKAKTDKKKSLVESTEIRPLHYPSVDIFVPAHNEQNVIIDTLKNLLEIDYSDYKIWIIDDRSIDKTVQIVHQFIQENCLENRVTLIERVDGQTPGKSASLNQALSVSNGDLVLVCDADARIQSDCLKLAVHYFSYPKVGAVQFQKKIYNADFNALAKCQDLEFAFDTYLQLGRDALNGFVELRGNGQITSRACLLNVGGWDERTLTDDLELSTRIHLKGWNIHFVPEVVVEEEGVITPQALFKQRRRWAEGSLRRYLTHFSGFLGPRSKLTWTKRLDILPYLTQFAIPAWVFLDLLFELLRFATNQPTHITTLMLATFLASLNMWVNICISVHRWRNYSFFQSLKYGSLAFFYGFGHWPPIVLWTMRKVIFGRRPTQWNKTPRMLDLSEKEEAEAVS